MLKHDCGLALRKSLNSDKSESKSLSISHSEDYELYTKNTEELQNPIKVASDFDEDLTEPARFHTLLSYTSVTTFLRKLRAVPVDHTTDASAEFVELLNASVSHILRKTIPLS